MTRTREVFPTTEIPHLFANAAVTIARNPQGNAHFSGADLWSYSTRVASIYPSTRHAGDRVLLLSANRYSNTTGRLLDRTRAAFRGHGLCVDVPNLGGGHGGPIRAEVHKENVTYFRETLDGRIATARRSRVNAPFRFNNAAEYAEKARAYCDAFKISPRAFPVTEADELRAAATDPVVAERAAAAAMDREKKRTAAEKAARKRREKEEARKNAERRAAWLAGDPYAYAPTGGPTLLRTIEEDVETSRGARVPLTHALAMYSRLATRPGSRDKLAGERIGVYTVSRVESDRIIIGCHELTFTEIERWAVAEGIADPARPLT